PRMLSGKFATCWVRSRGMRPRRARRGRRVVAAVSLKLQELVGLVRPELRDHRVRVQDGVRELTVDALDLQDVDVLGRIPRLVELDRPTGILDGLARLLEGGQESLAVFD